MTQEKIKVGDVVKLKRGYYEMTVGDIGDGFAVCYQEDKEGKIETYSLLVGALEIASNK
jgi:uncharacterized protein YodC (DUF2158 family)